MVNLNAGNWNSLEAIGLASYGGNGAINNFNEFARFENMRDLFYDHLLDQPIILDFGFGIFRIEFKDGKFMGVTSNLISFAQNNRFL